VAVAAMGAIQRGTSPRRKNNKDAFGSEKPPSGGFSLGPPCLLALPLPRTPHLPAFVGAARLLILLPAPAAPVAGEEAGDGECDG
jgi:hypothetical protein